MIVLLICYELRLLYIFFILFLWMPNVILFTLDDIGKTNQINDHIKVLTQIPYTHVYIIGYQDTILSNEIRSLPNLTIKSLVPFPFNYLIFKILLFPFMFVFLLSQIIGIFFQLPKCDLLIVYMKNIITEPLFSYIGSKIIKSKLVFDLSHYTLVSQMPKAIENKLLRIANVTIVSTQSKQMILYFRNIKAFLMRIIPYRLSEIVNRVEYKTNIIGFIYPYQNTEEILKLNKIMNDLEKYKTNIDIYIFGTSKSVSSADTVLKNRKSDFIIHKYISLSDPNYFNLLQQCRLGLILSSSFVLELPPTLNYYIGAGVPVIALKVGCISEIITDKKNGYLIHEEETFSTKIIDAIRDDNLIQMRRPNLEMHDRFINDAKETFKKMINGDLDPKFSPFIDV